MKRRTKKVRNCDNEKYSLTVRKHTKEYEKTCIKDTTIGTNLLTGIIRNSTNRAENLCEIQFENLYESELGAESFPQIQFENLYESELGAEYCFVLCQSINSY